MNGGVIQQEAASALAGQPATHSGSFRSSTQRQGTHHALLVLAAALLAAASAVVVEIVDIQWSGDGWFLHANSVAPGKFVESCGELPAGLQVRWQFEAGAPVDFNEPFTGWLLSPMIVALAMSLSSASVFTIALQLRGAVLRQD